MANLKTPCLLKTMARLKTLRLKTLDILKTLYLPRTMRLRQATPNLGALRSPRIRRAGVSCRQMTCQGMCRGSRLYQNLNRSDLHHLDWERWAVRYLYLLLQRLA